MAKGLPGVRVLAGSEGAASTCYSCVQPSANATEEGGSGRLPSLAGHRETQPSQQATDLR